MWLIQISLNSIDKMLSENYHNIVHKYRYRKIYDQTHTPTPNFLVENVEFSLPDLYKSTFYIEIHFDVSSCDV